MTLSNLPRLLVLLRCLPFFSILLTAQDEIDPARVIIVFDASGSMA